MCVRIKKNHGTLTERIKNSNRRSLVQGKTITQIDPTPQTHKHHIIKT